MTLASLSSTLTSLVSAHGLYAVFVLMLAAAIIPIGSELVMLYGGAVASGAFSAHVVLFGHTLPYGWWSYVAMALTGIAVFKLFGGQIKEKMNTANSKMQNDVNPQ